MFCVCVYVGGCTHVSACVLVHNGPSQPWFGWSGWCEKARVQRCQRKWHGGGQQMRAYVFLRVCTCVRVRAADVYLYVGNVHGHVRALAHE